jgi:hypothetical protein
MPLEGFKGSRLEAYMLSSDRDPKYRVSIWNPRQDSVQDVVLGRWEGHEYDISEWVETVEVTSNQVFENNDDAVSSRAVVKVRIDETGIVLPDRNIPVNYKIFRDGTPIRIWQGDAKIDPNDWALIFTGIVDGYPSANVAKHGAKVLSVQAFDRAQAYLTHMIVGKSFKKGTDLGDVAVDVALNELDLEREEIRFGLFDFETKHVANALAQISKMRGLYELMAPVKRKPYFNGAGNLVSHITDFTSPPLYSLINSPVVVEINRLQESKNVNNAVEVIGLDYKLTEIVESEKELARVSVTVGYFDSSYRETVYYSKDRSRRAKETRIWAHHKASFDWGADVSWQELNEFSGKLTIDTGYAPWVIGLMSIAWALLSGIEYGLDFAIDMIQSGKSLVGGGLIGSAIGGLAEAIGVTALITLRSITQGLKAAAQLTILKIMKNIGRFEVVVFGKPFENVYQELRSIAFLNNVNIADQNELDITMHWLTDIESVSDMAKEHLRRELSKAHTYEIIMYSNPVLEVDDIIEVQSYKHGIAKLWGFYIYSIRRRFTRGRREGDLMNLKAYKIYERD